MGRAVALRAFLGSRLVALVLVVAACGGAATPAVTPGPLGGAANAPSAGSPATPRPSWPAARAANASAAPSPAASRPVAPTASRPASQPATPLASATAADWPVYHRNAARTGYDPGFPAPGTLTRAWSANLDGAVYGQPIVVGGRIFAATENDTVYALDPASGAILWQHHLGTPVPLSTLPCGNIDPLGITSTMAYDPATGSIFASAELAGPKHTLFALDPATGTVRWSRSLDLVDDTPQTLQQRGALAVGNGYVYTGFGGLAGDCGQYSGKVIGIPTDGTGPLVTYRVPVAREGAIWSPGGPVIDAGGNVYVSVGNGSSTTTYDGSDSVLKLSPALQLKSRFTPSRWRTDNARDLDLGSLSPVLVPGGWVFIAGKAAIGYVLRQNELGGIGGQVSSKTVCKTFGGAAQIGAVLFIPCTTGIKRVSIRANGSISLGWHTSSGANGPPVVGNGTVWSLALNSGQLNALSTSSGAVRAHIAVGTVPHFASPTLWNGLVLVGTMHGVVAVRVGP
ncbi:MAG TPA: PQQ-binding-like beta-propeller repeat protein [Candidatus Limnocylindrales bacterium]